MIYRLIDRTDAGKIVYLALFFDGTNHEEALAYLQTNLASTWTAVKHPTAATVFQAVDAAGLGSPSSSVIQLSPGDWYTGHGKQTEAQVRADWYLADDELH